MPTRRPRLRPPAPLALITLVAAGVAIAAAMPGAIRAQGSREPYPLAPAFNTTLHDPAPFAGPPGWSYELRYWMAISRLYALRDLPPPLPPAIRTARTLAEMRAANASTAQNSSLSSIQSGALGLSAQPATRTSAPPPAAWGSTLFGWFGRPGSGGAGDARARMPLPKDRLTVVLLGTDRRPSDTMWRTDTIMVASVDWASGRVGLLSVPRDLWVTIPGHGPGRINTADYLGELAGRPDAGLVKDTLSMNLGVVPDRFVRIDLEGFVTIIDALGGIDLVVDCPIHDAFRDPYRLGGRAELDLAPGVHHVDGATALRYARSRHGSSDFARAHRQQRVLRAVQTAVRRRGLLDNGLAVWPALAADLETDLTPLEIATLAFRAAPLADRLDLHARTLGAPATQDWTTPDGAQVLVMDPDAAAAVVADVLTLPPGGMAASSAIAPGRRDAPSGPDGARGPAAPAAADGGGSFLPGAGPKPAPVASIVNATGRPDWGAVAEALLTDRSLRVAQVQTDTRRAESVVYFPPGAEAAGRQVAEALALAPSHLRPAQTAVRGPGLPIRVILGADWAPCPQGY